MTDTIPTGSAIAAETREADDVPAEPLEKRLAELERTVESYRLIRDAWTLIIFAIAAVALLASVIAVGFAMRAIDESERGASPNQSSALAIAAPST
jgi:hypothetical protein